MSSTGPIAVCCFESRRAAEMQALIEKFGGIPTVAPSMREIPLEENSVALSFADRLLNRQIDQLVLMTGVGTRYLADAIASRYSREAFLDALRKTTIVVRGPKPVAVLNEWKVPFHVRAPEPNTWRELLSEMLDKLELSGKRIAVQEYGSENPDFLDALRSAGAFVESVIIYRWALPEDRAPLEAAIRSIVAGTQQTLLFTSAQQIRHVQQVAAELGILDEFMDASNRCRIASIGPTCTEALQDAGLTVHFEASPPKMGHLVRGALTTL